MKKLLLTVVTLVNQLILILVMTNINVIRPVLTSWLTDTHQWLTDHLSYAKAFCRNIFCVMADVYSPLYCGIFSMATLYIFMLMN